MQVPFISSFYGILIYMFKELKGPELKGPELKGPHKKPHIHAVFAGEKLTIAFDREIFTGNLPRKQQKLVEAWIALHEVN